MYCGAAARQVRLQAEEPQSLCDRSASAKEDGRGVPYGIPDHRARRRGSLGYTDAPALTLRTSMQKALARVDSVAAPSCEVCVRPWQRSHAAMWGTREHICGRCSVAVLQRVR
jgi:hypothetical protein